MRGTVAPDPCDNNASPCVPSGPPDWPRGWQRGRAASGGHGNILEWVVGAHNGTNTQNALNGTLRKGELIGTEIIAQ